MSFVCYMYLYKYKSYFSIGVREGNELQSIKGNPSQYVKLNVGGSLYYTTIGTLTKVQETMLQAMFSGRMEVLTDSEGEQLFVCIVYSLDQFSLSN